MKLKLTGIFLLFFIQFVPVHVKAQNLISNGDFEKNSGIPSFVCQWYKCDDWFNLNDNRGVLNGYGSPDYFHVRSMAVVSLPESEFATVQPFSGEAIMGFCTYSEHEVFREYLSTRLNFPVLTGGRYRLSFWLTNGESNWRLGWSSNHIGVKFSRDRLFQSVGEPLEIIPTLEIREEVWEEKWRNFVFEFEADSDYYYITFGNFYSDKATSASLHKKMTSNVAYYYIDKVELIQTAPPKPILIGDTNLCKGDETTLRLLNARNVRWLTASGALWGGESITIRPPESTTLRVFSSTTDTMYVRVHVSPKPQFDLGEDTILCSPHTLNLRVNAPADSVTWEDSVSAFSYLVSSPGMYNVSVRSGSCTVHDSIRVDYIYPLKSSLQGDTTLCLGTGLLADPGFFPHSVYEWSTGENTRQIRLDRPGKYKVTVRNTCFTVHDFIVVENEDCSLVRIPNVFTPNSDGINDFFRISASPLVKLHLIILNRWGGKVYESAEYLSDWDAEGVPDGVYFYHLTNKTYHNEYKGTVQVLR